MKSADKFFLRQLTAISAFNYEVDLPIYDGVCICYQDESGNKTDLITLYCDMYSANCKLLINKDIKMSDYVKSYEDFKALDAIIEKAKYHIKLAHEATLAAAYLE